MDTNNGGWSKIAFSAWLTERMSVTGYRTDAELAEAVAVAGPTVNRWRNPQKTEMPRLENMRPLARALDVHLLELYMRAGWITEKEAGSALPVRETIDPRVLPLIRVLREVDQLPERQRKELSGQLGRSLETIIVNLHETTATFIQILRGRRSGREGPGALMA